MLRKRLGLSTEPQPVFVGSCFALLTFVMQIYLIIVSSSGKLIALFNNPVTLLNMMTYDIKDSFFTSASWLVMAATPLLMFIFALIFGKKKAALLCIPSCLPMSVLAMIFILASFLSYHIVYVAYFITGLLYIALATGLMKSAKPICIASVGFIIIGLILTALNKPPFYLFTGELYLSELLYFVCYHLAVFNFARAIPMQRRAKSKSAE